MKQTELSMVNALLESIEESPVQSIDLTHPDVQLALDIWDTESIGVQGVGWWFNTEVYELSIDTRSGEVFLPANIISIDAPGTTLVKRGRRLYNNIGHTYLFDVAETTQDDLTITCLMEWSLEELPPTVYGYILALCKIAIVANRDFDAARLQGLERMAGIRLVSLQKQHLRYSDPNRLNVNAAALMLSRQVQRYNG